MAAPAFVSSATGNGISSVVVTAPSGLVAGNFLVAIAYDSNTNDAVITNSFAPSGWARPAFAPDGGSGPGAIAVWTHTVGVSEPGTYAFDFNNGGRSMVVAVLQYSGTDGLDGTPAIDSSMVSSTSFVADSVTATYSDDTLICAFGSKNGRSVSSVPSGMASRARDIQSGTVGLDVCDKALSVSGATGTSTETLASSDVGVVVSLLLRATGHTSGEIDVPLQWSATVAQDVVTTSWSGDDDSSWQLSLDWSCVIDLDPPDDVED